MCASMLSLKLIHVSQPAKNIHAHACVSDKLEYFGEPCIWNVFPAIKRHV